MPITPAEWEERKTFVGFGADDEEILAELHIVARTYADDVMHELYARWLTHEVPRSFFRDSVTLNHVRQMQKRYFLRLTSGNYGAEYLLDRLRIGSTHRRIGLAPRWYMGAYSIYMQIVFPKILAAFEYDRRQQARALSALVKLISLDQQLALETYFASDHPASPV